MYLLSVFLRQFNEIWTTDVLLHLILDHAPRSGLLVWHFIYTRAVFQGISIIFVSWIFVFLKWFFIFLTTLPGRSRILSRWEASLVSVLSKNTAHRSHLSRSRASVIILVTRHSRLLCSSNMLRASLSKIWGSKEKINE